MNYATMIPICLALGILSVPAGAGADASDPIVRWEFDTKA
jgi:hypothetical protein